MFVVKYEEKYLKRWNSFVRDSKNATFLFNRGYVEYHSKNFNDFSLVILDDNGGVLGLLPCSIQDTVVTSHAGLTYGGLVVSPFSSTIKVFQMLECVVEFLKENDVSVFVYKSVPHIYHKTPAEEDLYAIFRLGFILKQRSVSSSFLFTKMDIKGQKINGFKRGLQFGFELRETNDSSAIIDLVNDGLLAKYNTTAVHSADEMNLLKHRFKKNIVMFELLMGEEICGGAILYIDNGCVHAQYITTNQVAKSKRGLDFIVVSLMEKYKNSEQWFDYGTSTEEGGSILNLNLIKSKEEFNMSAICYDVYELVLS